MNDSQPERGTEDAMDWYAGGVSKASGDSGGHGMEPKPAEGLPLVLQKINLVTALAALVLFFLPWIDIQCSGTSMATQSGVQVIYGGGSPSQEMKDLDEKGGESEGESMGFAPLVGLALLAVIGAVAAAFAAIRSAAPVRGNLPGVLCAVALGLIALQMSVGFPVKKKLAEELSAQSQSEQRADDPFAGLGEGMAQAMMMQIQVRHLPSLYFMLVALGLPTLILANGLIDRMKRS
ncbi:MAG TPA: hypothetical protein VLO11_02615 [Luteolibacter sp.]|nr:hypothetical protein [Luteolibacter sp.]